MTTATASYTENLTDPAVWAVVAALQPVVPR